MVTLLYKIIKDEENMVSVSSPDTIISQFEDLDIQVQYQGFAPVTSILINIKKDNGEEITKYMKPNNLIRYTYNLQISDLLEKTTEVVDLQNYLIKFDITDKDGSWTTGYQNLKLFSSASTTIYNKDDIHNLYSCYNSLSKIFADIYKRIDGGH